MKGKKVEMNCFDMIKLNLKRLKNCPICKGTHLKMINKARTMNPHSDLQVEILKCYNCSHWFVNPTIKQNDLNSLYDKESEYVVAPKGWYTQKTEFSIPEHFIINDEKKFQIKGKKYLEIGIGSGLLFNYFKQVGYDCYGVEPGGWAKGLQNVVQDINELIEDKFDVVVLIDVLEHIEDPLSLVKKVLEITNMDGTVYASFPNNQSLRAFFSKEKWRMIHPFGHLHYFSKKSLSVLFESNGFRINRVIRNDLLQFSRKSLFRPPYFIGRLVWFFGQSFWGDQWFVHLIKK